jgi:predicted  nucleic acid-binding Zn-ribbon protein
MSPDAALLLIDRLGIDDNWKCVSLELNIDSYKHRIDSSYSLQVIEGLLLKAYQHGYNTRVEIADHRKVSLREVMDVFHDIANGVQGRQALREMDSLRKEIKEIRQDSRLALNIARKIRNREPQQCDRAGKAPKKAKPPATFTTAAELCKHSPQAAGTQGAGP